MIQIEIRKYVERFDCSNCYDFENKFSCNECICRDKNVLAKKILGVYSAINSLFEDTLKRYNAMPFDKNSFIKNEITEWYNQAIDNPTGYTLIDEDILFDEDSLIKLIANELRHWGNFPERLTQSTRGLVAVVVYKKLLDFYNLTQLQIDNPSLTLKLPSQLRINLTDLQRELLFDELKTAKFISDDTDKNSFLWATGGEVQLSEYRSVMWIKNVESGRYKGNPNQTALYCLYWLIAQRETKYLTAEQERIINALFVDERGQNMKIPSKPSDINRSNTTNNKLKSIINGLNK